MKQVNYRVKGMEMLWNDPEGAEAILAGPSRRCVVQTAADIVRFQPAQVMYDLTSPYFAGHGPANCRARLPPRSQAT